MHKAIICTLPCCNNVLSISDMDSWQLTLSIYLSDLAPDWSVKPYFSHPKSVSLTHKTFNQMWRNFVKIFVHETFPKYFWNHMKLCCWKYQVRWIHMTHWLIEKVLKTCRTEVTSCKIDPKTLLCVRFDSEMATRCVRTSCAHCNVQCAQRIVHCNVHNAMIAFILNRRKAFGWGRPRRARRKWVGQRKDLKPENIFF